MGNDDGWHTKNLVGIKNQGDVKMWTRFTDQSTPAETRPVFGGYLKHTNVKGQDRTKWKET